MLTLPCRIHENAFAIWAESRRVSAISISFSCLLVNNVLALFCRIVDKRLLREWVALSRDGWTTSTTKEADSSGAQSTASIFVINCQPHFSVEISSDSQCIYRDHYQLPALGLTRIHLCYNCFSKPWYTRLYQIRFARMYGVGSDYAYGSRYRSRTGCAMVRATLYLRFLHRISTAFTFFYAVHYLSLSFCLSFSIIFNVVHLVICATRQAPKRRGFKEQQNRALKCHDTKASSAVYHYLEWSVWRGIKRLW